LGGRSGSTYSLAEETHQKRAPLKYVERKHKSILCKPPSMPLPSSSDMKMKKEERYTGNRVTCPVATFLATCKQKDNANKSRVCIWKVLCAAQLALNI